MTVSVPVHRGRNLTRIRSRVKEMTRQQVRGAHAWSRAVIPGRLGGYPEFLVIGGMRCGTTSLFRFLVAHPDITPALGKELQYFTLHYRRGDRWYRGNFPDRGNRLSFEASPYYLFDPAVPQRVAQTLPEVKLVALLRNPVDRAYSHYLHNRRRGVEPLPFGAAIQAEAARLDGAAQGRPSQSPARLYSYASRGLYADQLQRWWTYFPPERLHIIRSEDLFTHPQPELDRLADFLGITRTRATAFERCGTTGSESASEMTPTLRGQLEQRFTEPNQRLGLMLGWAQTWPTPAAKAWRK